MKKWEIHHLRLSQMTQIMTQVRHLQRSFNFYNMFNLMITYQNQCFLVFSEERFLGTFPQYWTTIVSYNRGSFRGVGGQWHRVKDQPKGQKERLLLDWLTRYKVDNSIQPMSFSRGKKFGIWYVSMTSELVDKYWGVDQSWDSIEGASYFYAQQDQHLVWHIFRWFE